MPYALTPVPKYQYVDQDGNPLAGGKINTYAAGTSTPLATYSDDSGTANANPIILGVDGTHTIYLAAGSLYKFVVTDADDNLIFTQDNISAAEGIRYVESVTGLDTDNTDPYNPVVEVAVDGVTITGSGTPGDPLTAAGGSGASFIFVDLGSGTSFTVDWSAGGWFKITPTNDFSIAFSNTPGADECRDIVIEIVSADGFALTLPAGGTWGALGEPEWSPNTDLVTVGMRDGSSTSFWMLAFPGSP